MGLRIDRNWKPITDAEWEKRKMRQHSIRMTLLTILEIAAIAATVYAVCRFVGSIKV